MAYDFRLYDKVGRLIVSGEVLGFDEEEVYKILCDDLNLTNCGVLKLREPFSYEYKSLKKKAGKVPKFLVPSTDELHDLANRAKPLFDGQEFDSVFYANICVCWTAYWDLQKIHFDDITYYQKKIHGGCDVEEIIRAALEYTEFGDAAFEAALHNWLSERSTGFQQKIDAVEAVGYALENKYPGFAFKQYLNSTDVTCD